MRGRRESYDKNVWIMSKNMGKRRGVEGRGEGEAKGKVSRRTIKENEPEKWKRNLLPWPLFLGCVFLFVTRIFFFGKKTLLHTHNPLKTPYLHLTFKVLSARRLWVSFKKSFGTRIFKFQTIPWVQDLGLIEEKSETTRSIHSAEITYFLLEDARL